MGAAVDRAAHVLEYIDEVDIALGRVGSNVGYAHSAAAERSGRKEVRGVGSVRLNGVGARRIALTAGDAKTSVIVVFDLDPKGLHDRHSDVDVFGLKLADHLDFQAVVGIGGDEQQRGEELAALAGVELGFSAFESLGPHLYWQASVGKARAHVDPKLAERVE